MSEEKLKEVMKSLTPDEPKRLIGLYGAVDEEKSAELLYSLMLLHEDRIREVPRELSPVEVCEFNERMLEAEEAGEEDVEFDFEFEEVSKPIEMVVSTPGGAALDMFAIYDVMRMVREDCEIHTFGLGKVMSAGVLIMAAGTKGKRKIGKNCRVMIHSVQSGYGGSSHEIKNEVAEMEMTEKSYIDALVAETSMTEAVIRDFMNRKVNVYLSAEEAVKLGIADIIV